MAAKFSKEDIVRITGKLEAILPQVKAAGQAAALEVKGKVARAPKQPHRKMGFKSLRQRLFVIAAIQSGLIDYPYRRAMSPGSEALSKSWTIGEENGGLTHIVGNDTSYGPYVQGEEQSSFHQATGWPTTEQVKEEMQPVIAERFQKAVRQALTGG